jgi:hypothetical protein
VSMTRWRRGSNTRALRKRRSLQSAARAEAADLEREGRRPVRQARLRLGPQARPVSLSGRHEYAPRRFTSIENGMAIHKYWSSACPRCPIRSACTTSDYRRVSRWEHEAVLERMQKRLDRMPQAGRLCRQTVEHAFGTVKSWMGATHFLTRTLPRVRTEMSLHVLAYNLKRVMQIVGVQPLIAAMRA